MFIKPIRLLVLLTITLFSSFLASCQVFVADASSTNTTPTETNIVQNPVTYVALSERPPALLEIQFADTVSISRVAQIPFTDDFGNKGPEGLAYIGHDNLRQLGIATQTSSTYYLVGIQKHGDLYLVEWRADNQISILRTIQLPGIDRDIAALQLQTDGLLWVMVAKERMLYQFTLAELFSGADAKAVQQFHLEPLDFKTKDIEGIYIRSDGTALLANDSSKRLIFTSNFPQCVATEDCPTVFQIKDMRGASDVGWDERNQHFVFLTREDDASHISILPDDTIVFEHLLSTEDYDLEGISVLP